MAFAGTGFSLNYSVRDLFLDRVAVYAAIDDAERKKLSMIGGWIRKTAQRNVRRRKRSSKPGQSPTNWSNQQVASLRNILYYYDRTAGHVMIGPVKLNQVNMTATGSRPVTEILEHGATVSIPEEQWKSSDSDKWFRVDGRKRKHHGKRYRRRSARYEARPFVQPALDKAVAKGIVRDAWINSIVGRAG